MWTQSSSTRKAPAISQPTTNTHVKHFYRAPRRQSGMHRRHLPPCPHLHWSSDTCTSANVQPAPSDMLSGLVLENAVLFNATKKVVNPPDKLFFMSFLAGFWVGLGGLAAISAAGGVPDSVRSQWVSLPKFLMGSFFAFALHFIAMFGGDLFTGNTMILAIGYYNRVISLRSLLLNWLIVYIGNWAGTLVVAYFLGFLTDLFGVKQYRDFLDTLVIGKLEDINWGQIFLRAIPANIMVCMALMLGIAARGAAGKIMALWFPVVMFVLSGFEHCVANMIFCSVGLLYGAPSSIGRLWYNQSAAVCGNIVGGVIFIGLAAHLMNHWKSPFFRSTTEGTLLGHDVESTRYARDVRDAPLVDLKEMQPISDQQERLIGVTGQDQEASDSRGETGMEFADCSDDRGVNHDGRSASASPESEEKEAEHGQAAAPHTEQSSAARRFWHLSARRTTSRTPDAAKIV